jgi:farnesyl diphosphate synthase
VNTGFSFLKRRLTEVEHEDLSILGWLNELFQAAYLILDDIMDNSEYPERQAMLVSCRGHGAPSS